MGLAAIVFQIGAAVMAAAPTFEYLMLGRFLAGIGIGFGVMIAPVYIAEISPAVLKGGLISSSMKSYMLSKLSQAEVNSLKSRPRIDFSSIFGVVNPILEDVRSRGDAAVKDYTAHFDKVTIDEVIELVADLPDPELEAGVQQAFDVTYSNIHAFHVSQKAPEKIVENMSGVRCKSGKMYWFCGSLCSWRHCSAAVYSFDACCGETAKAKQCRSHVFS